MELIKQIYDAFTTDFAPHSLGCLRHKNTVNPDLSDVELFTALPMKDLWEDAELPSVYFYLRRNRYLMVPESWEDAIHDFDKGVLGLCYMAGGVVTVSVGVLIGSR